MSCEPALKGVWITHHTVPVTVHLPVREAQIVQEALDRVRVRYVPGPDYTPEAGDSIIERLRARMGPVEVTLEAVDEISRTANGKFRAVICNLSSKQIEEVQRSNNAATISL